MIDILNIVPLKWDSDFFGISIGLVDTSQIPGQNFQDWKKAIKKSNFDLIYIFCNTKYSSENVCYYLPEAKHVDGKTTYVKNIENAFINDEDLKNICPVTQINTYLYKIVIQIGEYSRFATDKKFPKGSYERLYNTWLEKSIERIICDEVFAWTDITQKELGLITLGSKKGRMDIGLIGVEKEARGKGIAGKLLLKAEKYALEKGFKQLQVVTQDRNKPACSLYEKHGFCPESLINIFHFWNNKK